MNVQSFLEARDTKIFLKVLKTRVNICEKCNAPFIGDLSGRNNKYCRKCSRSNSGSNKNLTQKTGRFTLKTIKNIK